MGGIGLAGVGASILLLVHAPNRVSNQFHVALFRARLVQLAMAKHRCGLPASPFAMLAVGTFPDPLHRVLESLVRPFHDDSPFLKSPSALGRMSSIRDAGRAGFGGCLYSRTGFATLS